MIRANGVHLKNVKARCPQCHVYKQNNEMFLPADNNHNFKVCYECALDTYTICKNCNKFYGRVCNCHERKMEDGRGLDHYAIVPNFEIHANPGEKTYGVELELYNKGKKISVEAMGKQLRKPLGEFALIKHDGSIKDKNGLEIVLPPMSLNGIDQHRDRLREMFKIIKANGWIAMSEDTCAGHVHYCDPEMSNNQLIQAEEWWMAYPVLLITLSRRAKFSHRYAALDTRTKAPEQWSSNRYRWLNYSNICTVEHRYLAGISTEAHMLYNIEMADSVTSFGLINPDIKDKGAFQKYIKKNSDRWPRVERQLRYVRDSI